MGCGCGGQRINTDVKYLRSNQKHRQLVKKLEKIRQAGKAISSGK